MKKNRSKKKSWRGDLEFALDIICGGLVVYFLVVPFFYQNRDDFIEYFEHGGVLALVALMVVFVMSFLRIKRRMLERKNNDCQIAPTVIRFFGHVLGSILLGAFFPIMCIIYILVVVSSWIDSHANKKKHVEKYSERENLPFDSNGDIGEEYYDSVPIGGKELEDFLAIGGTFILPAVNSTHLYLELKKVYKEWSEDFRRYFALRINSFAANDKIPDDVLVKLVGLYSEAPWHDLCIAYTWEWAFCVGGIDENSIPMSLRLTADAKAERAIKRAEKFIMAGNERYESLLRSIPRSKIKQELEEFRAMLLKNDLV